MNESYMPITVPIWTLARLRYNLKKGEVLPDKIHLGGRIFAQSLVTADGVVKLPRRLNGAKDGDLVAVEVSTTEDFTKPDPQMQSVLSWHRLVSSTRTQPRAFGLRDFKTAQVWARFLQETREFFIQAGLIEMTTPTLVRNPGMEPELEPFAVLVKVGSKKQTLFLPTSPELHLKQLLVAGFTDIFEIKTVFRNEELTQVHEPEFQMLEWYRAYADLEMIKSDLGLYIAHLRTKVFGLEPAQQPLAEYSVATLFERFTNFRLTPQTTLEQLRVCATEFKLSPSTDLGWNDLFHLIWVSTVEPQLPQETFLMVDYPPSQAALARLNSRGWADRFELYMAGVEIANAFHELNDPQEQRRRFERDQKKRLAYKRTPLEIDENFMAALEHGLPPSGGIALGLDRLFMVLSGLSTLAATRAFSLSYQFETSGD